LRQPPDEAQVRWEVRAKIGERFRLRHYIDMEGVDAFDADVL